MRVLVALMEGVEELELVAPVDLLRRAGAKVVVASVETSLTVTGRNGLHLVADASWAEVAEVGAWDLVFLPGGPGVARLRAHAGVLAVVSTQAAAGRPLAAICAAPLVLKDAGLLVGKAFTAHASTADELPAALADRLVVRDGHLTTGRGAGAAIAFGLALVEQLYGADQAAAIARAIGAADC